MKKTLDHIITEIRAGMVLFPIAQEDWGWNNASNRAISIIEKYKKGEGLFQLGEESDSTMEERS